MSLKTLSIPRIIDTSSSDIIADFFVPLLSNSIRYDRGVGFFSASWIRIASQGLLELARNHGKARWIISPILDVADWNALFAGSQAKFDEKLYISLFRTIDQLKTDLEENTQSALAWMVADEMLEFRLAMPRNKLDNEFHAKFGIFSDSEGNQIAFNGSYNDSVTGTRNYEEIDIYCSWNSTESDRIAQRVKKFERLWNNEDPNVRVFQIPEAAREEIIKLRNYQQRPYLPPQNMKALDVTSRTLVKHSAPKIPTSITLRNYQEEAIHAWFVNNGQGILEMATGTGKTITALAAAVRLLEQRRRLLLVVACPYKHLVAQWTNEAKAFGFNPIAVSESRTQWEPEVARNLKRFQRNEIDSVTIITTNNALWSGILPDLLTPNWSESLLIVDEAHYAGAPKMSAALPNQTPYRLGLSATPIRHYDNDGSEKILDYFNGIVFSLPLEDAIGTFLTPYNYYPIPIEMTDGEFKEYSKLTHQLRRLSQNEDEYWSDIAQRIAFKRARILNNSHSKLEWLQNHIEDFDKIKHTLFYVGDSLFPEVTNLLGIQKHIRIHEFTQRQSNRERSLILQRFERGDLQALVAMRCLDEGVDVPPTKTAYFLASSGNPREFVQRRGRVLRKSPGKDIATIYDLIAIPPRDFLSIGDGHPDYSAVRAAIRREYKRVKEFARLAQNHYEALDQLFDFANQLDLLDA